MIANKKEFSLGLFLFTAFWVVFFVLLQPIFNGQNILNYMDSMYNSISKNSAYYIPEVKDKAQKFAGQDVSFTVAGADETQAVRIAKLFQSATATASVDGNKVKVEGNLGLIINNALDDSDAMFANNGTVIAEKYGFSEKQALVDLWTALSSAEKDLKKHEKFKEALMLHEVITRAVEPSYNYYGIKAESIKEKIFIVVVSLGGYVIYTLWYGFSILFMFEGWGLKLEH